MSFAAWLTIVVVIGVFAVLALSRRGADAVLFSGLTVLIVTGVVSPSEALAGFGNQSIATVAILFVVAGAMQESGAVWMLMGRLLGRPKSVIAAQARLIWPVAGLSGFINNTPLVVMMVPALIDWCRRITISPSRVLIPLSYASILGGMCTLIGTSTNLLVAGLAADQATELEPLSLFTPAWVGVPCAIAGLGYILIAGRKLLPERKRVGGVLDDPREYTLEMIVPEGSPLAGTSVESAGLRSLPGLFLIEIDREGSVLAAPGPESILKQNDRLVFAGVVESIVDLQKMRGLQPATDQVFKLNAPRRERMLIEAVVSHSSPMLNATVRESRFRTRYDAAIIAVARNGERMRVKIGDIVLRPGDTLLLESHAAFIERHRNSRDFYLVSGLTDFTPPDDRRAFVALTIFAAMIAVVAFGLLTMFQAALVAAIACVLSGTISGEAARRSIDWRLIVAIASAFGLGQAVGSSGAAAHIAGGLVELAGGSHFLVLAAVYIATMIFTEFMTNNAAAALMFSIGLATAHSLGISPMPFVMAVMIAASAGFASPLGYQTHLIVLGPGGYRFSDFVRFGLPLNLIVMTVALTIIPLVWKF